jgi:hypothetical protein
MGNASVYELVIDGVLLIGLVAKVWLLWESHLDTQALNRAEKANGKRTEIRVEQVNAGGKLFVIVVMLALMVWWSVAIPEPRRSDTAAAIVMTQAVFAAIVLALVGPSVYALIQRRAQMKRYRTKQVWDGQERRKQSE